MKEIVDVVKMIAVLKAARDKIADPQHWNKGCYARDSRGERIDYSLPEAYSWCLSGAIKAVSSDMEVLRPLFDMLSTKAQSGEVGHHRHMSVPGFNDHSSHEEVLELVNSTLVDLEVELETTQLQNGSTVNGAGI